MGKINGEDQMTMLPSLMMVTALLVSTASLAVAQNGPATGGQPPIGGGAAGPAPSVIPTRTSCHHGTRHHRMYMISVNRTHKGSKLTPANSGNQ
jgi:hypothetical protein